MRMMMPQNAMYGDVYGNLYYQRTGLVPIRPEGHDWTRPVPGDTSATEWLGFHDTADLVQLLNPAAGWMQNCNISPGTMTDKSPLTADRYPAYVYLDETERSNPRGRQANARLAAAERMTLEEALSIANDTTLHGNAPWRAALFAAHEARADPAGDALLQQAIDLLRAWDGRADKAGAGMTLYRAWWHALDEARDELPLEAIEGGEALPEDAQETLVAALAEAVQELQQRYGRIDVPWGEVHRARRGEQSWPVDGVAEWADLVTLRAVHGGQAGRKGRLDHRIGAVVHDGGHARAGQRALVQRGALWPERGPGLAALHRPGTPLVPGAPAQGLLVPARAVRGARRVRARARRSMGGGRMNSRERFLAAMRGERPDRTPVAHVAALTTVELQQHTGCAMPEVHLDAERLARLCYANHSVLGLDGVTFNVNYFGEPAALGSAMNWGDRVTYPSYGPPIWVEPEEAIVPEDLLDRQPIRTYLEATRIARRDYGDQVGVIAKVMGPLSMVQALHGVDKTMIDLLLAPDVVRHFLDVAVEILVRCANAELEAGADAIAIGEGGAGGSMLSPQMHERFLLDVHRRLIGAIQGPTIMHICGDITPRLEALSRSGLHCFNFDWDIAPRVHGGAGGRRLSPDGQRQHGRPAAGAAGRDRAAGGREPGGGRGPDQPRLRHLAQVPEREPAGDGGRGDPVARASRAGTRDNLD